MLVTGASGYIGGRLVPRLLERGYRVRVMTRDAHRLDGREWEKDVEIAEADAMDVDSLIRAMQDVDAAYYLIHSMHKGSDFRERDRNAAHNFGQAAEKAGVEHLIYLGGLGEPSHELSEHLRSRQEVGSILRDYAPAVTEFRAAIIVGSGSVSFEMIRYLTERLPVMIGPRWLYTKVQPIAIRDTLSYLMAALDTPKARNRIIEIGGTDVMTYADMMLDYADVRGLERHLIPVPILTPRLSSYWVHLVTPIPSSIARPLIDGLMNEVIVRDDTAREVFPEIDPIAYKRAVALALGRLHVSEVETLWTDSLSSLRRTDEPYEFREEQGMMIERRQRILSASEKETFHAVTSIGGSRGWLYLNWLWALRGLLDRILGGPGYRSGRRDPEELRVGDTLDFWRVEEVEQNDYLLLRAEMLLPGRGWLEFEIEALDENETRLTQTAYFAPKGFGGFVYWYSLFIPHKFIFDGMIDALVAEAESQQNNNVQAPANRSPFTTSGIALSAVLVAAGVLLLKVFQKDK